MRILYTTPSAATEQFTTDATIVLVGRLKTQQQDYLSLQDRKISAHHARLTFEDGAFWIEDLDSTNGTQVDGNKITVKTRLKPSSIIRMGGTTLKLDPAEEENAPPSPAEIKSGPDADPVEKVAAKASLPDLVLADTSPKAARQRLSAFCELIASLGDGEATTPLAATLLQHLHKAFSRRGRQLHSGLLMGKDLMLKAYQPDNKAPTCSLTLARYVQEQRQACLWHIDDSGGLPESASLVQHKIHSAMYAPLAWKKEVLGVIYLDATSSRKPFDKEDLQLMQAFAIQAAMHIKNNTLQKTLQREALVKSRLLAQFPPKIAERLALHPGHLSGINERVEKTTVLISDVRGFTRLSAGMEPEQVVQMLNDMFYDLTPIIIQYNGTVDKYIGDAVLAVFGSPDPDAHQWEHAVQAAIDMQAAIERLASTRWKKRTAFRIGIGIHTGPVIHGFIGAPERMEYTVIGDTINCASRYCDAAAPDELLISPAVYERVHRRVKVEHPARQINTKHEGKLKAYVVRGWEKK